jgi:hypothetical protein
MSMSVPSSRWARVRRHHPMDGHRTVPLLFQPRTQQPHVAVPGTLVREVSSYTCDRRTEGHLTPRCRAMCRASRHASGSCEPAFVL